MCSRTRRKKRVSFRSWSEVDVALQVAALGQVGSIRPLELLLHGGDGGGYQAVEAELIPFQGCEGSALVGEGIQKDGPSPGVDGDELVSGFRVLLH